MEKITMPLSKEDIKLLQKETKTAYIWLIIIAGVYFSLIYYLYKQLFVLNKNWEHHLFQIIVISFLLAVLVYLAYLVIQTQKDIKLGKKEVLIGVLTKKEQIYKKNNRASKTTGDSKYDYYFYLDQEKIKLDNHIAFSAYHKAQIGQKIVLQRSIYTKTILKINVLNETE